MNGPGGRIALVCGALILAAPFACSASITSCTVSATSVVFGTYTPLTPTALLANGTVNITCTGITGSNTATIDLSQGTSGSYATRTLTSGVLALNYNLYLDAAYTQVWGDGTGTTFEGSAKITNGKPNPTLTVYGAVAALQDPGAGSYTDTIIVTVNY